jgi:probable rRNA maturation factor
VASIAHSISLSLSLQFGDAQHRALLKRVLLKRWVTAALLGGTDSAVTQAQITLRFVSEAEGRELNQQYRGKDYATNVLTFDYALSPVLMADIVICSSVIAHEADEQNKTLLAHYAHMIIHGVLHACGHDHVRAKEAKKMESLEVQHLCHLGFANPYDAA